LDYNVKLPTRALVLEGGGMRGTFTTGVLEAFAEILGVGNGFDYVVGCSAGALSAASYLAGQPDRNRRIYLEYLDGSKFIRWSRLFTGGNVMDIDYLFDDVTVKSCPLNFERLQDHPTPLHIGVMDAETGQSRYLSSHKVDLLTALKATCALPSFYRTTVTYEGRSYVDGGVGDPVPIKKALGLGARELVVVLTSAIEKRTKEPRRIPGLTRLLSPDPTVRRALESRHLRYREAAELLDSPPPGIRVHIIRPSQPLAASRATRNRAKLERACDQGYEDGLSFLRSW
jgi:predicted patatin/cPLA2 family phospholipase